MSYVWPNGKFLIFLFQFGSLAIKAMAFWEISPLALLCALYGVSCMVKCEISNISPHCFGTIAAKVMAFWEISLFSHQICRLFQTCQNKFINLIHHHIVYTLAVIT